MLLELNCTHSIILRLFTIFILNCHTEALLAIVLWWGENTILL